MGLSCRSSSSCPSPPRFSSKSIAVDNELQRSFSPRLSSSHSGPLKKTLPDEVSIYWDSEKAFGSSSTIYWDSEKAFGSSSINSIASNDTQTPKSSEELRKEIAILEVEIMYLENQLLSLYRTAFEEHLPALSNNSRTQKVSSSPIVENLACPELEPHMLKDSSFYDSSTRPKTLSTEDHTNLKSDHHSLADHLGASKLDGTLKTPDRLSEQMVRCISSIYCKIADPSQSCSASPTSSLSSSSIFSSHNPCDSWSAHCNENANQFQGLDKKNSGRHAATVEVLKICLDDNSFSYAVTMLQNFRSMVSSLEKVDPSKMTREQKLAFWINIHNALVMHAYLAYGSQNRVKSTSILKAAYNVGGQHVNAYDIQSSVLGIRSHTSPPWLQSLFSPGRKPKAGSTKHVYALEYSEPLVHFALCSGAYSDPMVRAYTAKSIFPDLKLAREEFIQANVQINKETKILLPKILDYFAKDMSLNILELLELVSGCLSEVQQNGIRKCMDGKLDKYVQWLHKNSTFRFVIHGELAKGVKSA